MNNCNSYIIFKNVFRDANDEISLLIFLQDGPKIIYELM